MFNIGFTELILILMIAFVVVGPQDLPKVARWLGRTVKRAKRLISEFKTDAGLDDIEAEIREIRREAGTLQREADLSKEIHQTGKILKENVTAVKNSYMPQPQSDKTKKEE